MKNVFGGGKENERQKNHSAPLRSMYVAHFNSLNFPIFELLGGHTWIAFYKYHQVPPLARYFYLG